MNAPSAGLPRATVPRATALWDLINRYLQNSGRSFEGYSQAVVDIYYSAVPLGAQCIKFRRGGTSAEVMAANAKTMERFRNGKLRTPMDLEEPLVLALPDLWRRRALQLLANRYGLMAAPLPHSDPGDGLLCGGRFIESAGAAVYGVAGMIATDDPGRKLRAAATVERLLHELMACNAGMRGRINYLRRGGFGRMARENCRGWLLHAGARSGRAHHGQ